VSDSFYRIDEAGDLAFVATAIHDGHAVREDIAGLFALTPEERLREEDPFTGEWTTIAQTRVVGLRSRFEVDLNRPRERAVYRVPTDAWGLQVWRQPPSDALVERSLAQYDEFYGAVEQLLSRMCARFSRVLVYDLHSYNHRRAGPDQPAADAEGNPEINVGTGTMDRASWAPVVDAFIDAVRARGFDTRENVRFRGGHFSAWLHARFPGRVCALAIEMKKTFMDEWTGQPDANRIDAVRAALAASVPAALEALAQA
jgi:N-formylglutamate amidohydrolase